MRTTASLLPARRRWRHRLFADGIRASDRRRDPRPHPRAPPTDWRSKNPDSRSRNTGRATLVERLRTVGPATDGPPANRDCVDLHHPAVTGAIVARNPASSRHYRRGGFPTQRGRDRGRSKTSDDRRGLTPRTPLIRSIHQRSYLMNTTLIDQPAARAYVSHRGDIPVHRLGFGAMRLTGKKASGANRRSRRMHRRAAALGSASRSSIRRIPTGLSFPRS